MGTIGGTWVDAVDVGRETVRFPERGDIAVHIHDRAVPLETERDPTPLYAAPEFVTLVREPKIPVSGGGS